MIKPNLKIEKNLWKKGYKLIAGLDEAGRGALAGPVVAAAVVLTTNKFKPLKGIKDSKKLSAKKRQDIYKILTAHPKIKWGIARVSEKIIDKINIKNAAELAMEKALADLTAKNPGFKIDFLIIDGNRLANANLKTHNLNLIVKADEKVLSCSLASIIAKVERDKIMLKYHKKFSQYGFNAHKGYPTKAHINKIKKNMPCRIHRKSFKPVCFCKDISARKRKAIRQRKNTRESGN